MSIRELRDSLASISEIVERDGEVLLTRHGRGVLKLVPLGTRHAAPSHAALRASMPRQSVPSEELVRQDRDRG